MEDNNYQYQSENYNKQLNHKLLELIKNIPESNGSRYFEKIKKTIGIIADENMYNYYKDVGDLIYINFKDRKDIIENKKIDIFLYVTAWKGLENDWVGVRGRGENLYEVIQLLKKKTSLLYFKVKKILAIMMYL